MKKIFTCLVTGVFIFSSMLSSAQNNYWKELDTKTAPSASPMAVKPDRYLLYELQTNNLEGLLAKAGKEYKTGVLITLPTPDNSSMQFIVWETPMMQPKLAAEFPEIKTYTATSTINPSVSAKLDFTDDGFRAMIYDGNSTYFIDPYSNSNDGYYLVFYTKDLPEINKNFSCDIAQYPNLLHTAGTPIDVKPQGGQPGNIQNGSIRHNYRLAMACTGEYAMAVTNGNPDTATVLSKIVSTVNRINGKYEREFSVSFTLVNDEASIIYINPNTDPFTCNLNMNCLLGENQTNTDNVIGSANYDIGHIFCTAGGGLASLSSTCNPAQKASAASTSGGPDDFHVPLHEMGHQFSAGHTFSANTGGCFGNGMPNSAYEPGSGSTIMSYGGACAPNNIVSSPDDYFNVRSLIEVNSFLNTGGSTCGTTTTGLNLVSIPTSLVQTYQVPKNTPFELVANPITPTQTNASISYNWEEYDTGNFGATESQDGQATSGPIMRSYPPTDSSYIRQFPIGNITSGTYTSVGERLPEVPRTVRFKLTARSILNGWGSFAILDSVVKLQVASSGPFRVTQPASATTLDPGANLQVKWAVAGTDQAPVNSHYVNIYLSLDGGQSFPILLLGSTLNNGLANVTIPNVYTTNGYIKVQGVSNVFYDVAHGKLKINGTTGIAESYLQKQVKVFPNPASDVIHLEYTGNNSENLIVNMYDLTGRLVWNGKMNNQLIIPVGNFSRGNYRIQLINSKTAETASYSVDLR